ncbi:MAG: TetR/AcrR family transcriptional regulator [Chloroflexota bacterium]|jgi:AcrR family transcriptional regulator
MSTASAVRHTAEERREEVLRVAVAHFGRTGLHGTSTETIAREVGISQPYLFRLFGTKKELFMEAVRWGFDHTIAVFREAGEEATDGHDALRRMGQAYERLVLDRRYLGIQLQAYASTDDPDIQAVVEHSFGRLVTEIIRHTELTPQQLAAFLGRGMLMNVASSMGVLESPDGWAVMVRDGCIGGFGEEG